MSNSIMIVAPYKYEEIWVFDDDTLGLVREPFVSGIPGILNVLVKDIPNAELGFNLFFSETPFPECRAKLTWLSEEYGGNWYIWEENNLKGWLCPALLKYFQNTPKYIYCRAFPKK